MHLSFKNIGRASINKKAMTLFNEFSLAINTRHPGTRASAAPVIFIIALLMLAGIIHPTLAASSPQSGRIRGKIVAVTADKREPLSGVLVSLSSDVLQDKTLEIVSDEEGGYVFSGLVAGDYVVSVTLQGFEKYERKVIVPIEAVVDLNVLLTPLALSESVTVTEAEGGLAKTESSLPSQVTTQNLRNAPLVNERFQDALPLLPGVVRGPDGALNIKGGRASQSGILVSSLNVTDPVTGNPGINLPTIPVPRLSQIPARFRGKKYRGRIGVKMFNITGSWNPRDVQNNLASPDFGTFYNSVGRSFRAKFEFVKF